MFDNLNLGSVVKNPKEVTFYDGLVIVLCVGELHRFFVNAEFDESITLAEIAEKYPNVFMVIMEDYLSGGVFRYGNSGKGEWTFVGTTVGFA